jgi:hypothetical protein
MRACTLPLELIISVILIIHLNRGEFLLGQNHLPKLSFGFLAFGREMESDFGTDCKDTAAFCDWTYGQQPVSVRRDQ